MEKAKVIHIMKDGTEVKSLKDIKVQVPESVLSILMQSCDRKEKVI